MRAPPAVKLTQGAPTDASHAISLLEQFREALGLEHISPEQAPLLEKFLSVVDDGILKCQERTGRCFKITDQVFDRVKELKSLEYLEHNYTAEPAVASSDNFKLEMMTDGIRETVNTYDDVCAYFKWTREEFEADFDDYAQDETYINIVAACADAMNEAQSPKSRTPQEIYDEFQADFEFWLSLWSKNPEKKECEGFGKADGTAGKSSRALLTRNAAGYIGSGTQAHKRRYDTDVWTTQELEAYHAWTKHRKSTKGRNVPAYDASEVERENAMRKGIQKNITLSSKVKRGKIAGSEASDASHEALSKCDTTRGPWGGRLRPRRHRRV